MVYQRGSEDRVRQVYRWLKKEFEPPKPLRLRIADKLEDDDQGYVCYGEKVNTIMLSRIRNPRRHLMIETLLHEYPHAILPPAVLHKRKFWMLYGDVYCRFFYCGGEKRSGEF